MKRKSVYGGYGMQPKKKRRISSYRPSMAPGNRRGYASVPRSRGASVRGEMKYFDTEKVATAIAVCTTTWVAATMADPAPFNCLCVPTVGAAVNQRIGRDIRVMKIKIRGEFVSGAQAAQAAADNGALIRYMVVQDTQTNSAQMTGAQLMTDGAAAETTINSYQNLNNFGRFRVLKDKVVAFSNVNVAGSPTAGDIIQSGFKRPFKCNIKFKVPIKVRFNATNGGTIADIIDHSFHFLVATENANLVASYAYTCRVAYKE